MYKNMDESWKLYPVIAVTNRKLCDISLEKQMEIVCKHGPKAIIIREKDLKENEYQKIARKIARVGKNYRIPCIYHTYWKAAIEDEISYVHLPIPVLKQWQEAGRPGNFTEIGASVHSVADALLAERLGATYLVAGHIYETECKRELPPRGTGFLREVCQNVRIPVYAIGGIHLDGCQREEIRQCGAKGACIMSELMKLRE